MTSVDSQKLSIEYPVRPSVFLDEMSAAAIVQCRDCSADLSCRPNMCRDGRPVLPGVFSVDPDLLDAQLARRTMS